MNGEDRTELSALRAEVRQLAAEQRAVGRAIDVVATKVDTLNTSMTDHEARIRGVEKWKSALPISTLLLMVSTAVALIALFVRT